MAVITITRGGGRISRIRPAANYAGVISRFSAQIQAAQEEKQTADIREQLVLYKSGALTFGELKDNVKDLIKDIPSGTLKKVQAEEELVNAAKLEEDRIKREQRAKLEQARTRLTNKLSEQGINPQERLSIEQELLKLETPGTEEYNRQQQNVVNATENAEVYKIEKRKTELLDKYKEGGISLDEELSIFQELRSIVNPDSKIAQQLAESEANIMTKIQEEKERKAKEGAAAGKVALQAEINRIITENDTQNKNLMASYAGGKNATGQDIVGNPILYPGEEVEMGLLQNFKEMEQALLKDPNGQAASANLGTVQEQIRNLQESITQRQAGQRFDVMGADGKFRPANLNEITQDITGDLRRSINLSPKTFAGVTLPSQKATAENAFIIADRNGLKAYTPDKVVNGQQTYKSYSFDKPQEVKTSGGGVNRIPYFKEEPGFVTQLRSANLTTPGGALIPGLTPVSTGGQPTKPTDLQAFLAPVLKRADEIKKAAVEQLTAPVKPVTQPGGQGLLQQAVQAAQPVVSRVSDVTRQAISEAQPTIQRAIEPVRAAIQPVISNVAQTIQRIVPQVSPPNLNFLGPVQRIVQPVAQQIQRTVQPVVSQIQRTVQPVISGFQQAAQRVGSFFGGLFGRR